MPVCKLQLAAVLPLYFLTHKADSNNHNNKIIIIIIVSIYRTHLPWKCSRLFLISWQKLRSMSFMLTEILTSMMFSVFTWCRWRQRKWRNQDGVIVQHDDASTAQRHVPVSRPHPVVDLLPVTWRAARVRVGVAQGTGCRSLLPVGRRECTSGGRRRLASGGNTEAKRTNCRTERRLHWLSLLRRWRIQVCNGPEQ